MTELRIIYVPEANDFCLYKFETPYQTQSGNERAGKIRGNYDILRQVCPDIPSSVGVVTYDLPKKLSAKWDLLNVEDPSCTFTPLEILERVLELRNEDLNSPIAREYVYRTLYLLQNECITSDPATGNIGILGPLIPAIRNIKEDYRALLELMTGGGVNDARISEFRQLLDRYERLYPTFQDIENLRQHFLIEFEKNRVSRDFPLNYLPRGSAEPMISIVDLTAEREVPIYWQNRLAVFKGMVDDRELCELVESIKIDKFGRPQPVQELEALISLLEEPRTIIADIYIVTQFPQIAQIPFKIHEFRKNLS